MNKNTIIRELKSSFVSQRDLTEVETSFVPFVHGIFFVRQKKDLRNVCFTFSKLYIDYTELYLINNLKGSF